MASISLQCFENCTCSGKLVAEQAAKLSAQEAEVIKRDSIIGLLRAQLELLRHRQHGASSEKIDRKIEQTATRKLDCLIPCSSREQIRTRRETAPRGTAQFQRVPSQRPPRKRPSTAALIPVGCGSRA
ncbi:hypothetical protein [Ensifer sp. 22460]|uniref:IS66 family transposase n=1 Tax=Ensifer sp. 22460 TaxID=3453922 RepID=UPI003F862EC9